MYNGWWALILVALLVAISIVMLKWSRSTAFVAITHNVVWGLAILLVGANFIDYKEAGVAAWLTLATGLVAFNVGVWTGHLKSRSKSSAPSSYDTHVKVPPLAGRRAVFIMLGIYTAAFVVYLAIIQVRFGLINLIVDPAHVRSGDGGSYLESVPLPVRLLLYLAPVLFAMFSVRSAIEQPISLKWRVLTLIYLAVSMAALLQRINLFMAILWVVAILLTQWPQTNQSRLTSSTTPSESKNRTVLRPAFIGMVAAFLAIAFFAFQAIGGALGKSESVQAVSTGNVSPLLQSSGLVSPYLYYTGGIPAFLQLTESTNNAWPSDPIPGQLNMGDYNPQTWGAASFSMVLKAVPIAKPWPDRNAFIDMGVATNVYTWLEPLYRDFRVPGVVIGTFLLGWLTSVLYRHRTRSPRLFWLQAAFISIIFLATFAPRFNNTLFLAEVAFVLLLTVRKPQRVVQEWWKARRRTPEVTKAS